MSDNRPPIYQEDDTWVFRGSAVGMSLRAMVALLMGYEPAPVSKHVKKAWALGHEYEDEILARGEKQVPKGWTFHDGQEEVEVAVPGVNAIIRGHVDGVAYSDDHPGEAKLVEAKFLGTSLWSKHINGKLFADVPTYADQLTVYMYALGVDEAFYVVGRKSKQGELIGTHVELVTEPPSDINAIFAKVTKALKLAEKGELPEVCDCGSFCPMWHIHPDNLNREELDSAVIEELAAKYKEHAEKAKEHEGLKREFGKELKAALTKAGVDKGSTPRFLLTVVEQRTPGLDRKKLALELGDDLSRFNYDSRYSYVKVTERKDVGGDE